MTAQPTAPMTAEEYLAFDRASETTHEFYDGELAAMAGASYAHNLIVGNLGYSLYTQLRGRLCQVLMSNMRLGAATVNAYLYPDLTIICGQPQLHDKSRDILLNPTTIIEVFSPATEARDRGWKFQRYRTIESLREYLLIDQATVRLEQFVRQANDRWLYWETVGSKATLHLPTIDCTLALADVYNDVAISDESVQPERRVHGSKETRRW